MANISITEIQGQDNPSQSRITFNENFNILKDAFNKIDDLLDADTGVGDFKTLSISLPTPSTPITTNIFSIAASGSTVGNFAVGETLTAKGGRFTTSHLECDGGNIEVKQAANNLISQGGLIVNKKIIKLYSTLLDATAYSALTSGQYTPNTYITNLSCTGNLTLQAGDEGQEIKLYMNTAGPVNIQTTNLTSIINAPIVLNAKGQVITLWYRNSKWHVIGTLGNITISYTP